MHQSSVSTDGRRLQVPKSESSVSATHAMHLSPRHMHASSGADIENGQTLFFAFTSIIQLRVNIFSPSTLVSISQNVPFHSLQGDISKCPPNLKSQKAKFTQCLGESAFFRGTGQGDRVYIYRPCVPHVPLAPTGQCPPNVPHVPMSHFLYFWLYLFIFITP